MTQVSTLIDTPSGSKLYVVENFSTLTIDSFTDLPLIEKPEICIYGKVCRQKRDVGFFSDKAHSGYKYSGRVMEAKPLSVHPILLNALNATNAYISSDFNGILVNRYNNGKDYISAHSDDESNLSSQNKMVASISYGQERTFRIRNKSTKKIVLDYVHRNGTLLIMAGEFQNEFIHEIPVQSRLNNPRISITMRRHM